MNEPAFEYLGELQCTLVEPLQMGSTPHGIRMVLPIQGGSFTGPKLNAQVLSVGADWFLVRNDGAGELDVRLMLRTAEGDMIYATYRGILLFTPEITERWSRGEAIPPEETYFRITPAFETGSEKYSWLNHLVVVGIGQLTPQGVCYQLYQVK